MAILLMSNTILSVISHDYPIDIQHHSIGHPIDDQHHSIGHPIDVQFLSISPTKYILEGQFYIH